MSTVWLFINIAKLDGFHRKKDDIRGSNIEEELEEEDDPYGEREADMRLGKKRVLFVVFNL